MPDYPTHVAAVLSGSSFTPASRGSDLKSWYDASDITTLTSDGARQFTILNSEYFTLATPGALDPGNADFTFAGWFYVDDLTGATIQTCAGIWDTTGNQRCWVLRISTDVFLFSVSVDGTNAVNATWSSSVVADTWYYVVGWHNAGSDTVNIQVNDETTVSTAHATGILSGTGDPFRIGASAVAAQFFGGRADSCAAWSRVLTAAERTWLYNSGSGRVYADIGQAGTDGSALTTNLISWWNLSEPSGNAIDAHSTLDLTDTNTVTGAIGIAAGRPESGDVVSIWEDKSSNASDLINSTVSTRPTYQAAAQNGKGSILFDGVNDLMSVAYTHNQPLTRYVVFKSVTWVLNDRVIEGAGGALRCTLAQAPTATPELAINATTTVATNTELAVGTYGIATCIFNGASSSLQINNTTATTGDAGATAAAGITLAATSVPGAWGNVQILEVVDITGADTTSEQTQMKNYFSSKWAITI